MILLSGHSLTPERKVPLEAMSLQLKERDSTATMTPADMTGIGVNSWLKDDTDPGAGIVWRVKSISHAFATDTPTVELEHVINTLKDNVVFGEITEATITGNANATTVSADQAIRHILSYQRDWVLGGLGYSVSNPYKFDGDSLYDALETISDSLNDAWWSYDTTVYPFRLYIMPKDSSVGSMMRAGRNLTTITRTIDRSEMYTRFYPTGADDLHIIGDYVEKNANLYGVVSKVETDSSIETEAELRRWAWENLNKHCEPTVTIDVEGFELVKATGESLDKMTLGRACKVPLPEFGTEIVERIVTLAYPDKVHRPEVVKLTLANTRTDVKRIIADAIKNGSTGKGGRTYGKQSKDDHAWIEDTEDHVALCAEAIIGRGPDGVDWRRFSTIVVDGEGIHQRVEKTEGDVVTAFTQIDANEKRILLEAQRAIGKEGELSANITVQADRITSEVAARVNGEKTINSKITQTAQMIQQEVTDRRNADNTLSSRITQTADAISLEVTRAKAAEGTLSGQITVEAGKINQVVSAVGSNGQVTAASICLAINNAGSSATINADKIYLLGQTIANQITADYIQTKIASLASLNVASLKSERGGADVYSIKTTTFEQAGVTCYLPNAVWNLQITQSGNTYTLQRKRFNDDEWVDVGSFSRATTLSGAWSSGKFTVSASPQGDTFWTDLVQGSTTWSGNSATVGIDAIESDSGGNQHATGRSILVDATARYNAGVNYAKPVTWTAGSEGTQSQFTAKATSAGGGSATKTYYLTKNGSYIEVHEGSQTGTMVARRSTS